MKSAIATIQLLLEVNLISHFTRTAYNCHF